MNNDRNLFDLLTQSRIYQDFERAFSETTGLPVAFRPVDSWQLPHRGRKHENSFCARMSEKSRSCAACLQVQQQLNEAASGGPQTVTCLAGLSDTAVPVRLGDRVIGFLQTGQAFRKRPTPAQFERVLKLMREWGLPVEVESLRAAYFGAPILPRPQYDSMVSLLAIFAEHLSLVGNQVLVHQANAEPPVISRAKAYVAEHQGEDLSLGEVARAVNTSTFYFCKVFKKVTGLNFTDYVSRVRIEKAKNLLLNPNLRISEIAFEVGFQSLTHFNRVFKKIVGLSPSSYRVQLPVRL